ncbi:MAG TPA: hypothetical protein VHW94_03150 [Candidatus Dormibacteraeota bacterium]|nr:hypothetical protein [Candidatus Dormibacteraeota bacterium]
MVSVMALAGGLMLMGVTNASAAMWCADDPTLAIGTPLHFNLNVTLTTPLTSTNVYASGTSSTTTFGFVQGIGK